MRFFTAAIIPLSFRAYVVDMRKSIFFQINNCIVHSTIALQLQSSGVNLHFYKEILHNLVVTNVTVLPSPIVNHKADRGINRYSLSELNSRIAEKNRTKLTTQ